MKVPDSALNLALPPSPNARIPGLVWLLGVFFLGLITVVTCHVAVAADYAYRFEDIQSVNEGEQATFTFEITQASVDGVPAANNEVQTGDFLELRFAIVDGSAVIDSDFSFDTGGDGYSEFVLFPGFRKVNITIKTADDQTVEPTETFALQFDTGSVWKNCCRYTVKPMRPITMPKVYAVTDELALMVTRAAELEERSIFSVPFAGW